MKTVFLASRPLHDRGLFTLKMYSTGKCIKMHTRVISKEQHSFIAQAL